MVCILMCHLLSNSNRYMGHLNIMIGIHATDGLFTYDSLSDSSRKTTTVWQQSHIKRTSMLKMRVVACFFKLFNSQIYSEIVIVDNYMFIVTRITSRNFSFCLFIRTCIPRSKSWVIHTIFPVYRLGLLHAKTSFNELVPTLFWTCMVELWT